MLQKLKAGMVVLGIATIALSGAAGATTLQQALRQAYQSNPSLQSTRAALRAQDESVAQARAGLRPSVSASATGSSQQSLDAGAGSPTNSFRASLNANLMLYDGGRTRDAIAAAENTVYATQANLRAAEQGILLQATIAYLDVRRDQHLLALAQNNVKVIEKQVQATKDRFEVGAVTRTQVALVEAQLAAAKTQLAAKSGALALSREVYRAVIGNAPVNLQAPPALPKLPASVSEAESIAMREHPALVAARFNEKAAEFDLARARAARSPTLGIGGSVDYSNSNQPPIFGGGERTSASVALTGKMPIYQGGALSSAMRSAAEILASRKANTQDTMRSVRQSTASAWANVRVANASITAAKLQIEASQAAFDGIQEEVRLGARTTLDLLDAEQNLLTARSSLASAQRDRYVATYNLLSAMGLLTVENLALGIPSYDPNVHFDAVKTAPLSGFAGGSVLDTIGDRWN